MNRLLILVSLSMLVSACRKPEVETYKAPRAPEAPSAARAQLPPGHPPMGQPAGAGAQLPPGHPPLGAQGGLGAQAAMAGSPEAATQDRAPRHAEAQQHPQGSPVGWKAPAGWKARPASGMRYATFEVPAGAASAELAVIVLGGDAGGALPNVNRWRGQLGLPPWSQAELKAQRLQVQAKAGAVLVVDLAAPDRSAGMVAAMLPKAGSTWFFKLTGSAQAAKAAKPAMIEFLRSLN